MTEDEMIGRHQQLHGHEFEQAAGVGDGQGSLSSPSPAFSLSQHQESFPVSQFFAPGGQSIGVSASASVLPIL